jgi:hypothetical protein
MKKWTVALYGGNLAMAAIAASLQGKPEFQVEKVESLPPGNIDKLNAAPPDAILFDFAEGHPNFTIPLLRNHPRILLIGVDLKISKMTVLSCEQSRLLTADDLAKVLAGG